MNRICNAAANCRDNTKVVFKRNGYPILECKACGRRYLDIPDGNIHLSVVYSDDYFFAGKDGYPNYLDEMDILYKSGIQYARILSKYTSPGKLLDVGCAAGFILSGFREFGWDCYGLEPNERMAAYGNEKLGLNIRVGGLETYESDEKFDVISIIQVVGHFYDIDLAFEKISHLLKPGGLVLVESWNMRSPIAGLLGKYWHEYSPPSTVNWFSPKTLTSYFNSYGFSSVAVGMPLKRISGKHALSLLTSTLPDFKFKKWMVDSLSPIFNKVTFVYPPLDLNWYIYKKRN